jgi:hypothetical protein
LFNALDRKVTQPPEAQKRVDTVARIVAARLRYGRVPLRVHRMRGFAVKRFPKWETEQIKEEIAKLEQLSTPAFSGGERRF